MTATHKVSLYSISLFILVVAICTSCKKSEGVGGTSSITGIVITRVLGNQGEVLHTHVAQSEKVYIIYGKDSVDDDNTQTSLNGKFQFQYLYKGDYRIYAYSECDLCDPVGKGRKPVEVDVTIKDNRKNYNADTIFLTDYPNVN